MPKNNWLIFKDLIDLTFSLLHTIRPGPVRKLYTSSSWRNFYARFIRFYRRASCSFSWWNDCHLATNGRPNISFRNFRSFPNVVSAFMEYLYNVNEPRHTPKKGRTNGVISFKSLILVVCCYFKYDEWLCPEIQTPSLTEILLIDWSN